jgi:hypothetical protein
MKFFPPLGGIKGGLIKVLNNIIYRKPVTYRLAFFSVLKSISDSQFIEPLFF